MSYLCSFSGELFVTSSHETEFLLLWNPDHSFWRQCARPHYGPRWVVARAGLDICQIVFTCPADK